MRVVSFFAVGGALVAIGLFGYSKVKENGLRSEGQKELQEQEAEHKECEKRLAMFYKAVSDYQKDHKDAMPPNFESLLPKYIKSGDLLLCPTAARWTKRGALMGQGQIEFERRKYPVTYGFRWLTAGTFSMGLRKHGDAVPLIVCDSHKEGMYRAVYKKPVPADAFSDEKRNSLVSEVRDSKMLAVRKNGKVEALNPDEEL